VAHHLISVRLPPSCTPKPSALLVAVAALVTKTCLIQAHVIPILLREFKERGTARVCSGCVVCVEVQFNKIRFFAFFLFALVCMCMISALPLSEPL
jgi:hypothetical protein